MTTGQAPRLSPRTGRGPCARIFCGHPETPDHAHSYDGARTHCALCGSQRCSSYRPPGRRRCARCGVRQNVHASLDATAMLLAPAGLCPWWVRPAPAPLRALTALLRWLGF